MQKVSIDLTACFEGCVLNAAKLPMVMVGERLNIRRHPHNRQRFQAQRDINGLKYWHDIGVLKYGKQQRMQGFESAESPERPQLYGHQQ